MLHLPADCVLIPVQAGELLISPSMGTYCAVLPDESAHFHRWMQDNCGQLPESLDDRLKKHGFYGEARPYRAPSQLLQFQITNACNLRCAYCSADSGVARPNELTLADIKQTVDEACRLFPNIHISFTGGEPLLVPWLFEAIDYAAERSGHKIGLLTNLLLLKHNDQLFDKVVRFIKNGHQLRASVSGADREVCNRLSGRDCYDDFIEMVCRLDQAGVLPEIDLMLSAPDSDANVAAFGQFRRSLPEKISISVGEIYICGREKGDHIYHSVSDKEKTFDGITFEGGVCVPSSEQSPVTCRRKGCSCVENENLYIRSDGGVYTCFKLVDSIGHISEGLETVTARRRKNFRFAAESDMCRACPFVHLCGNGCHADNVIFQSMHRESWCGPWRKKLIAEMLFDDKPYIFDWSLLHQMAEAKNRGFMQGE